MDSEYKHIYENKPYEAAVKDLKATFFDIISREEGLLNSLERKVATEPEKDKKEELQGMLTKQNDRLNHTLELISNLISEIEFLDSFTSDLNKLNNPEMANMIEEVGSRKLEKSYQKDLVDSKKIQQGMANNIMEVTGQEEVLKDAISDVKASIDAIDRAEHYDDNLNSGMETFVPDKIVADDVLIPEGVINPQEEIVQEEVLDGSKKDDLPVVPSVVEPVVTEGTEMVVSEAEDKSVNDVVQTSPLKFQLPGIPMTIQPAGSGQVVTTDPAGAVIVPKDTTSEAATVVPIAVQEDESIAGQGEDARDESTILLSPIDEDIVTSSTGAESTEIALENAAHTEQVNENLVGGAKESDGADIIQSADNLVDGITNSTEGDTDIALEEMVQDTQAVVNEELKESISQESVEVIEEKPLYRFFRSTGNLIRAILLTKRQQAKSLKSRETQESLLKVKGVLENNLAAVNTMNTVNNELEKDLTNNGLLPSSVEDKQQAIEDMLEQANSLYKAGKADEAQEMYAKISAMNKELQKENTGGMVHVKKQAA